MPSAANETAIAAHDLRWALSSAHGLFTEADDRPDGGAKTVSGPVWRAMPTHDISKPPHGR